MYKECQINSSKQDDSRCVESVIRSRSRPGCRCAVQKRRERQTKMRANEDWEGVWDESVNVVSGRLVFAETRRQRVAKGIQFRDEANEIPTSNSGAFTTTRPMHSITPTQQFMTSYCGIDFLKRVGNTAFMEFGKFDSKPHRSPLAGCAKSYFSLRNSPARVRGFAWLRLRDFAGN